MLAIVARLGTLKRLKIVGFERTLPPKVTKQLLRVVQNNKQMTHLSLEYFQEAAFLRLCEILADTHHCLRSLRVVLDPRTPKEIQDSEEDNNGDSSSDDESSNSDDNDESSAYELLTEKKDKVFLASALAKVLRSSNVNLVHCTIDRCWNSNGARNKLADSRDLNDEINYYLCLNASGRKHARGQCKTAFVEALAAVVDGRNLEDETTRRAPDWCNFSRYNLPGLQPPRDSSWAAQGNTDDRLESDETLQDRSKLQLLFGLLREAPVLWVSNMEEADEMS